MSSKKSQKKEKKLKNATTIKKEKKLKTATPIKKENSAANPKSKRGQTAIEYLSVYGWALVILILIIVAVSYLTFSKGGTVPTGSCYISTYLSCKQVYAMAGPTSTNVLVIFQNQLGQTLTLPTVNAFVVQSSSSSAKYNGNCYPTNAVPGASITCVANIPGSHPTLGSLMNPNFQILYQTCNYGACTAIPKSNTTGTASAYVSNPAATFQVGLETSTGSGGIALNGVNFPAGTTVLFIRGDTYSLEATPPAGYSFLNWQATNSITANLLTAVTYANTSGTGTITAVFNAIPGYAPPHPLVSLSFVSPSTVFGTPDIGTARVNSGASSDAVQIYMCTGPPCTPSTSVASGSGSTTFDAGTLQAGTYVFMACDTAYQAQYGTASCSAKVTIVVTQPGISLTITSLGPLVPPSWTDSGSMAINGGASPDTVTLYGCSGVTCAPSPTTVGSGQTTAFTSGTGTVSFNLDTFGPGGTLLGPGNWDFIACDSTYNAKFGGLLCSQVVGPVVITAQVPVFSFQYDPTYQGQSDIGTATGSLSDSIQINYCPASCTPSATGISAPAGPGGNPGMTTATTQVSGLGVGSYDFEACDTTSLAQTGTPDCSAIASLTVVPTPPSVGPPSATNPAIWGTPDGISLGANADTLYSCGNVAGGSCSTSLPHGSNLGAYDVGSPGTVHYFEDCDNAYYNQYGIADCSYEVDWSVLEPTVNIYPGSLALAYEQGHTGGTGVYGTTQSSADQIQLENTNGQGLCAATTGNTCVLDLDSLASNGGLPYTFQACDISFESSGQGSDCSSLLSTIIYSPSLTPSWVQGGGCQFQAQGIGCTFEVTCSTGIVGINCNDPLTIQVDSGLGGSTSGTGASLTFSTASVPTSQNWVIEACDTGVSPNVCTPTGAPYTFDVYGTPPSIAFAGLPAGPGGSVPTGTSETMSIYTTAAGNTDTMSLEWSGSGCPTGAGVTHYDSGGDIAETVTIVTGTCTFTGCDNTYYVSTGNHATDCLTTTVASSPPVMGGPSCSPSCTVTSPSSITVSGTDTGGGTPVVWVFGVSEGTSSWNTGSSPGSWSVKVCDSVQTSDCTGTIGVTVNAGSVLSPCSDDNGGEDEFTDMSEDGGAPSAGYSSAC